MRRAAAISLLVVGACAPQGRVPLLIVAAPGTPTEAAVHVDERYVGSLGAFKKAELLIPVGQHRITIEHPGYFPQDTLVDADREELRVNVKLERVPD